MSPFGRHRELCVLLTTLLLATSALSLAAPALTAPPDQTVAPGDFVTLTFRIVGDAEEAGTVSVETDAGWVVLGQPARVDLRAGSTTQVPVTVAVPANAAADVAVSVEATLRTAGSEVRASSTLRITTVENVTVQAPKTIRVGRPWIVPIANHGNVRARVSWELGRQDGRTDRGTEVIDPGGTVVVTFLPGTAGTYLFAVTTAYGEIIRRAVTVEAFGVPRPSPLALDVQVNGAVSTDLSWSQTVYARGPLSDSIAVDLTASASRPLLSGVRLHPLGGTDTWSVSVGNPVVRPLGLNWPIDPGVAVEFPLGPVRGAAGVGWVGADRFSGYVGASLGSPTARAAVAAGVRTARPELRALAERELPQARARLTLGLDQDFATLEANLRPRRSDGLGAPDGQIDLALRSTLDGTVSGRLALAVRRSEESFSARLAAGPVGQPTQAHFSVTSAVLRGVPTGFGVRLDGGTDEWLVRLQHSADVGGGWRVSQGIGGAVDEIGGGLDLALAASRSSLQTSLTFSSDLRLYPKPFRIGGTVSASAYLTRTPVAGFAAATADLSGQDVRGSVGGSWTSAGWTARLSAGAEYHYGGADPTLAGVAQLSASYEFAMPVPPAVTQAFGGRNLGTLEGRVVGPEGTTAGLVVDVGDYRLLTDASGSFRAELEPGTYPVTIDVTSIPSSLRLASQTPKEITVARQLTAAVSFTLTASASLAVHIDVDQNGDGRPDAPWTGGGIRLGIRDAAGISLTDVVGGSGTLSMPGLAPGNAMVQVTDAPLGLGFPQGRSATVDLQPGRASSVKFLVVPASTSATVFGGGRPRLSSLQVTPDRAPPGADVVVSARTSGDVDDVRAEAFGMSAELQHSADANWATRVHVPFSTAPGVVRIALRASRGTASVDRTAQLVIDPTVPFGTIEAQGTVPSGRVLHLTVNLLLDAQVVRVGWEDAEPASVALSDGGGWASDLTAPASLQPGLHTVTVYVQPVASDVAPFTLTKRVRVLAPNP